MVLVRARAAEARTPPRAAPGSNGSADRIDPLESGGLEFLPAASCPPASTASRSASTGSVRPSVGGEAVHVVEDVEQPAHQGGLRPVGQLAALPRDPLAVVVELGGEPEVPVAGLLQLVLEAADGLDSRLDRQPALLRSDSAVRAAGGRFLGHIGGRQIGAVGAPAGRRGSVAHATRGMIALALVGVSRINLRLSVTCDSSSRLSAQPKDNSSPRAAVPASEWQVSRVSARPRRISLAWSRRCSSEQRRLRRPRPGCRDGLPGNIDSAGLDRLAASATASHTVPTGLSGLPPPGPAMPVTATARSTPSAPLAPSAIARATASLTAPSRREQRRVHAEERALELVRVGDDPTDEDVGASGDLGEPPADQPAGARLRGGDRWSRRFARAASSTSAARSSSSFAVDVLAGPRAQQRRRRPRGARPPPPAGRFQALSRRSTPSSPGR